MTNKLYACLDQDRDRIHCRHAPFLVLPRVFDVGEQTLFEEW